MTKSTMTEILRLRISHEYYGDGPVPLRVMSEDPRQLQRDGMLLKREDHGCSILIESGVSRPHKVILFLAPEEETVWNVTAGLAPQSAPKFNLPLEPSGQDFHFADLNATSVAHPAKHIAAFEFGLPSDGSARATIIFDAVETFWTYHVTGFGRFGPLFVVDNRGDTDFDRITNDGDAVGRKMQSFRSRKALRLSAKPENRFELHEETSNSSNRLIQKLPAAGSNVRPAADGAVFHSDIYISV